MSSVFDQKIAEARDRIPKSVLDSPWKRTLLLVAFLVVGIAAVLFFAILGGPRHRFKELSPDYFRCIAANRLAGKVSKLCGI